MVALISSILMMFLLQIGWLFDQTALSRLTEYPPASKSALEKVQTD